MKAHISKDEWYPFYYIDRGVEWRSIGIPLDLVTQYDAALAAMDTVQAKLSELWEEQK